jgi:hypothetical protein
MDRSIMPPTTTCFEMSTSFVERFLDTVLGSGSSNRELILAENAALTIGESRLEKEFGILKHHREKGHE